MRLERMRVRVPERRPVETPTQRIVRPTIAQIRALWQAQGGPGLPPLAGASPLRGPSSATGGSSGPSQGGDFQDFIPKIGSRTNVPAGAPTFNPKGENDESPALQSFVNSCVESAGVVAPGPIRLATAVKVPALSNIYGLDEGTCRLIATGNNYIWQPEGGSISLQNFSYETTAKQVGAGGVVDCSQGFSTELYLGHFTIGKNFFQPFKFFGPAVMSLIECVAFHFSEAAAGGVTGYTGPVFAFGGKASAERTVNCHLIAIYGLTPEAEPIPLWFDFNNADTIFTTQFGFQFGTNGVRIGNNDASALQSTNIKFTTGFFDTIAALGFKWTKCRDVTYVSVNLQNCAEGGFMGVECSGGKLHDSTVQHSTNNGVRLAATVQKGNSIRGCVITDNNEAGNVTEANGNGVEAEAGASNFTIEGNTIGNVMRFGEKQRNGVFVAKGANNKYVVTANTFDHNTKTGLLDEGEGAEKLVTGNATFA